MSCRLSVQELRRDHDEQLQWLKQMKDQELNAVTSTTSHSRTLNGVIEQMEKFSSDLCDVLHRVEAMHHSTSRELAVGVQKQEKEFKVLQDSLWQQQRDVEEERRRLQEVVTKLEARLGEQTRLLEQEQQRALAERSRAESLQHLLEEERRVVTQQLSVERAELERAKVRWGGDLQVLFTHPVSVSGAEQGVGHGASAGDGVPGRGPHQEPGQGTTAEPLPVASSTPLAGCRERAEVKMRVRTLRAQEEQLAREKELLDEAWQELKAEREKVNGAALRVRQQEEELKSVTKLSSQKYEEGQRALREARRVESQHQSRLQALQWQLEQLRQQEEHLHQDRLSMAQQRSQLQQLRQELPKSCTMLRTTGRDSSAPESGFSSTLSAPHSWASVPGFPPAIGSLGGVEELLARASSAELSATLAMLKFRAQQDHAYLDNEQLFLASLKKVSYNAPFVPG
ncbi:unnamed protein product [Bubo scandiacus]